MYLLDTNVISELRRPEKADRNVVRWSRTNPTASFFLSAVSILEIETGALRMARKDKVQAAALRVWIDDQIIRDFKDRILPFDAVVAKRCARLHVADPRAERDAMIAATAMVHGLTIVTRNIADFKNIEVSLLNPWIAFQSDLRTTLAGRRRQAAGKK
jgi:predicted nucleic acid-binding protein